ncbi:TetR/AcrR family transcriptional regulator [Vagococcus entomophilus]|uniref:HTH tetR-type domain-containing protein n=1 Tax=Vagococcus entomophilus TaxID=1160095 RepID=A0A430AJJ3_9ENTE|nr:TetR/AcrR family transcriptional regulator [Vagococcus entomophilus]RSU08228.1 hypothetical protein CBF30_03005 [Vagococcus entomophilus]
MTEKGNSRKKDWERTHQTILAVASSLFMEKGYRLTSTREIAKKCDITQPNLYHHFSNKKEIYLAVIEALTKEVKTALLTILNKGLTLENSLREMIDILLEKHPTNLFKMLQDMSNELDTSEQKLMYLWFHETYISSFIQLFAQVKTSPKLKQRVSDEQAASFLLYNVSALMEVQQTYQKKQSQQKINEMIDMMLYGLYQTSENHESERVNP